MAAGGLGGDPVTLAKGGALRGSPVTARAAFVSAFLGNSWSRAREGRDGRGDREGQRGLGVQMCFSCGREEGKWDPVCSTRGQGCLGGVKGILGSPEQGQSPWQQQQHPRQSLSHRLGDLMSSSPNP